MSFDPSRGSRAFTEDDYRHLLSKYTNNLVRPYTDGKNYQRPLL